MARPTITKINQARVLAAGGVDYSPKHGALCPWCSSRTRIIRTMPWDGNLRIRYHRCHHRGCVLASLGTSIKSLEENLILIAEKEDEDV